MGLLIDIYKKLKEFTLDIRFESGSEILGVLGASGSGKSLTLRCIAGLMNPDRGKIVLNGRVLFDSEQGINIPVQEREVGLLFQNYALFPNLTVKENISFGLRRLPRQEQERLTLQQMELMGLTGLQDRYPHQISGGEQQRTALARTLVTGPQCLLLDEPFSALDNHIRSHLEKEMIRLLADYKGPTVFVTHNLKECYRLSKNIMILDKGKVISVGCRNEVFTSPQTIQAARLTGCKNISRLEHTAGTLKACDWGCDLKVEQYPQRANYVGIREHQIRMVMDPKLINTFPCWLEQMTETPFTVNLYLRMTEKPSEAKALQVIVSKEEFSEMTKQNQPWLIQIPQEHLFFMPE